LAKKAADVANGTAVLLGMEGSDLAGRVDIAGGFGGEAYGRPTPEMTDAVRLLAELEGILLDPVYTGKAMAGLIGLAAQGRFDRARAVVFIHTGGTPGLFAYPSLFPAAVPQDI
jgi:1-aminocyclopropane-1-carboxylate deaminase/D-cysteine desulfhydrase-like pyridoxal-dependent ACC family enzyme